MMQSQVYSTLLPTISKQVPEQPEGPDLQGHRGCACLKPRICVFAHPVYMQPTCTCAGCDLWLPMCRRCTTA